MKRNKNWKNKQTNKKHITSDLFPFQEPACLAPSVFQFYINSGGLGRKERPCPKVFYSILPNYYSDNTDPKYRTRNSAQGNVLQQLSVLSPRVQAYSFLYTKDDLCPVTDGSGKQHRDDPFIINQTASTGREVWPPVLGYDQLIQQHAFRVFSQVTHLTLTHKLHLS